MGSLLAGMVSGVNLPFGNIFKIPGEESCSTAVFIEQCWLSKIAKIRIVVVSSIVVDTIFVTNSVFGLLTNCNLVDMIS